MNHLIEVCGVSHQYHIPHKTIISLNNISFSIREGEFIAIVGANGSGKSTLARLLNATLLPSSGWIKVNGLDTRERNHHAEIRSLVGMVFQYPQEQIIGSTIEEDVSFGVNILGLSEQERQDRVAEALRKVGLWEQRERAISMLSAGQVQRVAIAGVLARRPKVMIFDETTSMLDPMSRKQVFTFLKELNQEGITILFITHDMEEAAKAERVIGLFEGRLVFDASPKHAFSTIEGLYHYHLMPTFAQRLANLLKPYLPSIKDGLLTIEDLGQELGRIVPLEKRMNGYSRKDRNIVNFDLVNNKPIVQVEKLGYTYHPNTLIAYKALDDINFYVERGAAYAVLGGTGSGKSTLLQHINALLRPQIGSIVVDGFNLTDPDLDVKSLRRRVGYAFQTPEEYFFEQYVGDELAYKAKVFGVEDKALLREEITSALAKVGLDFDAYKDRLTFGLSGGERRKIALASVFVLDPEVIVLDEPTAGLDPFSRQALLKQLSDLLHNGKTILFTTHLMEDAAILADRCVVLKNGRQMVQGDVAEVLRNENKMEQSGLVPPLSSQLINYLNWRGWNIPCHLVREEDLFQYIKALVMQ